MGPLALYCSVFGRSVNALQSLLSILLLWSSATWGGWFKSSLRFVPFPRRFVFAYFAFRSYKMVDATTIVLSRNWVDSQTATSDISEYAISLSCF